MEGRVRGAVHDTDWPDPLDPADPADPVACSKVGARLDQTLLCPSRALPGRPPAPGRPRPPSSRLRPPTKTQKSITLGMNGAAVPRHGLILSQDGATHSRKVSRYLPMPRDALKTSKTISNVKIRFLKILKTDTNFPINSRSTALGGCYLCYRRYVILPWANRSEGSTMEK